MGRLAEPRAEVIFSLCNGRMPNLRRGSLQIRDETYGPNSSLSFQHPRSDQTGLPELLNLALFQEPVDDYPKPVDGVNSLSIRQENRTAGPFQVARSQTDSC